MMIGEVMGDPESSLKLGEGASGGSRCPQAPADTKQLRDKNAAGNADLEAGRHGRPQKEQQCNGHRTGDL
jgi:hypothetical protein